MPRLYIHDRFDVVIHHDEKDTALNFIRQVRNNLAQLLQTHAKLPHLILILLSNENLDDHAFATTQLERMILWLLSEVEAMIKLRISQLPEKCKTPGEPAVYILKMLPRLERSPQSEMFKSLRRKINNAIPAVANKFQFGFINAYEVNTSSGLYFDATGSRLTSMGIVQLWKSISTTIQEIMEEKRAKIKPLTFSKMTQTNQAPDIKTLEKIKAEENYDQSKSEDAPVEIRRKLPNPDELGQNSRSSHKRRSPTRYKDRYFHDKYDYAGPHYSRYHYYSNKY